MSLKSTFLAFKKVVQVVQIGGGGQGNLDKIQKNSYFFRETFPYVNMLKLSHGFVELFYAFFAPCKQNRTEV